MRNVRSVSDLPIRYVLNSHHHGDHVAGNVLMREMGIDVMSMEIARLIRRPPDSSIPRQFLNESEMRA